MSTQGQENEQVKSYSPLYLGQDHVEVEVIEGRKTRTEDHRFKLVHRVQALTMKNFKFLEDREKAIIREVEELPKGRERPKYEDEEANKTFYQQVALGGSTEPLYEGNGFQPKTFSKEEMLNLNPEAQIRAVEKLLDCKANVLVPNDVEFLFQQKYVMEVELSIGDSENPSAKLLLHVDCPDSHRRSVFRQGFSYSESRRGGDLKIQETRINLKMALQFFQERFISVEIHDPNYSDVFFVGEKYGEEPKVYDDSLRSNFLNLLNPHYQVVVATEIAKSFNKSGED